MGLIKLDYGVLAVLAQSPMSGYDITNRLNYFWKTTHSRVYPVLSKLEKLGYVEHVVVEQSNKPDKKVYHLTPSGIDILKNSWLTGRTQPSIKKDESMLKVLCVHLLEDDVIIDLLKERVKFVEKETEHIRKIIEDTKEKVAVGGGKLESTRSQVFSVHLLTQGLLAHADLELAWCKWAIELYKKGKSNNFFNMVFDFCKHSKLK